MPVKLEVCTGSFRSSSCSLGRLAPGSPARRREQAPARAGARRYVDRALANEYSAAQDASHPMRYELRKTSPHWTSTKEICETKDGDVARLVGAERQAAERGRRAEGRSAAD